MADISRLVGKYDGIDIVFTRSGGQWLAAIPRNMSDGEYVLEFTAYDEAGNTAYTTAVLITVDLAALKVEIKFLNYRNKVLEQHYLGVVAKATNQYKETTPNFAYEIIQANFGYEKIRENFTYKAVIA